MSDSEQSNAKIQSAVALKYKSDEASAPKVVAKGEGEVADDIIKLAEDFGVLIHQDEELNKILGMLDLGQEIPPELYTLIAELISFSYLLQGKFPERWNNMHEKIDSHE